MVKTIPKILLTTLAVAASVGNVFAGSAHAAPLDRVRGAYRDTFSLNIIKPYENTISVHYYGVDDTTKTNFLSIYWANSGQISEAEADARFQGYGLSTPDWATNFVNKKTELSPNTEKSVSWRLSRYNNSEVNLKESDGVLYYALRLDNFDILYGKVDYRDCLNNEYFTDGAYCQLEKFEKSGELYYWPYSVDGKRLGSDEEPFERDIEEQPPVEEDPEEVDPGEMGPEETEPEEEPKEEELKEESPKEQSPEEKKEPESLVEEKKQDLTPTIMAQNGDNTPKTPDTGQNNHSDNTSASLAYLILPMLGLIGMTIWWSVIAVKHKNRK